MLVILVTQEAGIRKITVWSQPRPRVCKTLSQKKPFTKQASWVAKGEGPEFTEFKLQYSKKKRQITYFLWALFPHYIYKLIFIKIRVLLSLLTAKITWFSSYRTNEKSENALTGF
jgi:hypothetical protein